MGLKSILAGTILLSVYAVSGMASSTRCPPNYPFPSCPREKDKPNYSECCVTHAHPGPPHYQCCDHGGHHPDDNELTSWEIVVIVIVFLLIVAIFVGICACCCGFCACLAGSCCRQTPRQYVYIKHASYQTV